LRLRYPIPATKYRAYTNGRNKNRIIEIDIGEFRIIKTANGKEVIVPKTPARILKTASNVSPAGRLTAFL
jgi:hypothetical protein